MWRVCWTCLPWRKRERETDRRPWTQVDNNVHKVPRRPRPSYIVRTLQGTGPECLSRVAPDIQGPVVIRGIGSSAITYIFKGKDIYIARELYIYSWICGILQQQNKWTHKRAPLWGGYSRKSSSHGKMIYKWVLSLSLSIPQAVAIAIGFWLLPCFSIEFTAAWIPGTGFSLSLSIFFRLPLVVYINWFSLSLSPL